MLNYSNGDFSYQLSSSAKQAIAAMGTTEGLYTGVWIVSLNRGWNRLNADEYAKQVSQSANEMQDAIMSSWENRNTSQDIISQKQSDATMGFERVMDTETGEIYQTDDGFTDWYDGERYTAITDDQYTEAVVGRFSWK
jgi:hypothetical protein